MIALVAVAAVLSLSMVGAPSATAATTTDFVQDLLAACPNSGQPVPSSTGRADSCDWVPMDANGIAIDTANNNSTAVADPKWMTSFWQPDQVIGHTDNCLAQPISSGISKKVTTGSSSTLTWGVENEVSVLKIWSIKIKVEYSTTTTTSEMNEISATAAVPAYHSIDWLMTHYMQSVQGRIKVVLHNWKADPTNPSGGKHRFWYPPFTLTSPATSPSGGAYTLAPVTTPMNAAGINACGAFSQQTEALVSKYGTEYGTAAAGYCATVAPTEMLSTPCTMTAGAAQQFVFVPIPQPDGGTRYLMVNPAGDGCLGAPSGTVESAALLQACDAAALSQVWSERTTTADPRVVWYVNAATGLCLNAWAAAPAPVYGLNQAQCADADTQLWSSDTLPFPGRASGDQLAHVSGTAPQFTSVPRASSVGSRHDLMSGDNMIVVDPGSTFTYRPVAVGSPAPTVSISSQLPGWLTFTDGELHGVVPNTHGIAMTVPVSFTAMNSAGSAAQVAVVSISTGP
jgi:hypothetical protein